MCNGYGDNEALALNPWGLISVCCRVLQCVAVCCSVLQCVAVCCNVLQCVAVCCSVLQEQGMWNAFLNPAMVEK